MSIKDWLKIVSLKTTLQNYEQSSLIDKGLVLIVIKGNLPKGFGFIIETQTIQITQVFI